MVRRVPQWSARFTFKFSKVGKLTLKTGDKNASSALIIHHSFQILSFKSVQQSKTVNLQPCRKQRLDSFYVRPPGATMASASRKGGREEGEGKSEGRRKAENPFCGINHSLPRSVCITGRRSAAAAAIADTIASQSSDIPSLPSGSG